MRLVHLEPVEVMVLGSVVRRFVLQGVPPDLLCSALARYGVTPAFVAAARQRTPSRPYDQQDLYGRFVHQIVRGTPRHCWGVDDEGNHFWLDAAAQQRTKDLADAETVAWAQSLDSL